MVGLKKSSTNLFASLKVSLQGDINFICQNFISYRTVGPCGMNKGDIKTTIPAGQPLTVTWHLGYPHGGKIVIELLSPFATCGDRRFECDYWELYTFLSNLNKSGERKVFVDTIVANVATERMCLNSTVLE